MIIKSGDVATHLNFLRMGEIEIFVSSGINMHFEAKEKMSERDSPRKSMVGVRSQREFDENQYQELFFDSLNTVSISQKFSMTVKFNDLVCDFLGLGILCLHILVR